MTVRCVYFVAWVSCVAVVLGPGCDTSAKPLGGPIAVVEGDVPTHGFLGVGFSREASEPLLLEEVFAGSPAATAGVMVGDKIVTLNGKVVSNRAELGQELAATQPGDVVQLELERGKQRVTLDVRLLSFADTVALQTAAQRNSK